MCGPLRPSPWIQHQFFSIIYQKIITFHPAELFFFIFTFLSFLAKMAWNAIVCETTDVSRETATLPIFQKTWFQAILAKKNEKKNEKTKTEKKRKSPSTKILWSAKILQSAWILQYVYVPSCGVRCPRWSAKNLWNAKNSEYAWLV